MHIKFITIVLFLSFSVMGCATKFRGDAKIDEGPVGCEKICTNWKMELAGMVAFGEYTNGCICKKRESNISINDTANALVLSASGIGGVARLIMEERESLNGNSQGLEFLFLK